MLSRRTLLIVSLIGFFSLLQDTAPAAAGKKGKSGAVKYVRFQKGETIAYGILEGNRVRQLSGCLFGDFTKTDTTYALDDVTLLVPTQPTQVIAMAGNYKSHLGEQDTTTTTVTTVTKIVSHKKSGQVESESKTTVEKRVSGTVPELFQSPQPFFKTPACLLPHGGNIVIPKDAGVVHYEAEMVIVIGKKAKNVSKQKALDYVLGVTCGNDVSARVWQKNDVQWWRAKGSDTFGPCGPCIASGIDYDNLQIQLRLNGEVKQQESTGQLIHDVAGMVSFISRHVTLNPGDLIFTGTPGKTSEIKPGDVVEVELEGVGVLKNNVVAEE